jgi:membrane associated rhomboid family serine protease
MPPKPEIRFSRAAAISASLVAVLFLVKGAELVFRLPLDQYGIVPRSKAGLVGILAGPLLHANLSHLIANSIPLLVLLVLLLSNPAYHPCRTLALIWAASGAGTWLIGRGHTVHIGASSLVFGLVAFLIAAGFLIKTWRAAAVAVLVFVLYGGIFYGVLPQPGPISWEGHLCGAVAGVWTARNLR